MIGAGGARKPFGIDRQSAMRWRPENCTLEALERKRAWRNGCGFLRTVWLFRIGRGLYSQEFLLERSTPEREVMKTRSA